MIQLASDCLLVQLANGERVPLSAGAISVELTGPAAKDLDVEFVQHAAAAVVHHFKNDLGQISVTTGEFSAALEKALQGFGLQMPATATVEVVPAVHEADLRVIAAAAGRTELLFYSCLRDELRSHLAKTPQLLRFRGLRGCVLQLAGAARWCARCRELEAQILNYLRQCFAAENRGDHCLFFVE